MNLRNRVRRNLHVAAINEGLLGRLFTLAPGPVNDTVFEFKLAGLPVIAHAWDWGFDEVGLRINVCPTPLGRESIHSDVMSEHKLFTKAWTLCTLERRTGCYIQTSRMLYCANDVRASLAAVEVEPMGFGLKPTKRGYDYHKECESVFGTRGIQPIYQQYQ